MPREALGKCWVNVGFFKIQFTLLYPTFNPGDKAAPSWHSPSCLPPVLSLFSQCLGLDTTTLLKVQLSYFTLLPLSGTPCLVLLLTNPTSPLPAHVAAYFWHMWVSYCLLMLINSCFIIFLHQQHPHNMSFQPARRFHDCEEFFYIVISLSIQVSVT